MFLNPIKAPSEDDLQCYIHDFMLGLGKNVHDGFFQVTSVLLLYRKNNPNLCKEQSTHTVSMHGRYRLWIDGDEQN